MDLRSQKEQAEYDRRIRLSIERPPDWKAMARDPVIQWIGINTLQARIAEGRFAQLKQILPLSWACLIDREVREAYLLQSLDDIMREDQSVVVRGLHGLTDIQLGFLPWTLKSIPDDLAWALFAKRLSEINTLARISVQGVERLTPRQFEIWKYFRLRYTHWTRHDGIIETCLRGNEMSRSWWEMADWSASDYDETVEKESWFSWFMDGAHSVAVAGIELIEDLAGAAARVVHLAAQGIGLMSDETEVRSHIRWLPDPWVPTGLRQVIDTENITPLARLGEQIITGVGAVDDALRAEGLRKSARIAIMAGGTAIGIVIATKCLIGAGKLAKWPFSRLWMWWHAPAVPVMSGASAFAAGETLTLAQVSQLPAATQMGIASILTRGATHASWLAVLGKTLTGAKGIVVAATGLVGGIVFAKFFLEENDQQNGYIIREALERKDRDWAIAKLNRHIAQLEEDKNVALLPAVGTLIAANRYIDNALENRKKTREWLEADKLTWDKVKAKVEAQTPLEAKELPDPQAPNKAEKMQQMEDETRSELIAIFMEIRRIRIFLGHKRVKAGEDVSIDKVNIPLLRTWINRDRMALTKDRNAALEVSPENLELWLQRLQEAGFNQQVLNRSDREIALAKMGPYKKFK